LPLGDAHRAMIDERLAEHERNPDDVVSRDRSAKGDAMSRREKFAPRMKP
jgi:hypothetical protein